MLVSLKELMKAASEGGYAVGAFNVSNLESLMAIMEAAEETGHGVILNYAEVHAPFLSMEQAAVIMLDAARNASVPVCVHLDHGSSMEACIRAIRLGFTSVMLDASAEDYETNVRATDQIVRLAHSVGVTVEAELGHIFSSNMGLAESPEEAETLDSYESADDVYTDPATAKDFVERTEVDVLAIAFGTTHGIYTKKPVLDLDRITKIRQAIDIPFVMHGGSGLSKEEFQTAIQNGIRKINYYTYMTLAGGKAVKEAMDQKGADENVFFHDIPMIAVRAMKENVKQAIRVFSMEV
ncbi:class II fructose-bisphosphate aldolase [Mordavella massiliensis]|jgi:fructose-bisphosphate aldolase class II|uniref:Class II fructose-bisphosphate aldolase n=1 Tax=Mordavella massiliensis TaxID=1871024 RepID=A0A938X1B0_9CLOT|nr:class II fructose-bisphosphate aldolase [Mordavella massiliensis]MBM6826517.1 class II fructose-bisphosphate aldolase [Mordavella massiliensis]MBM6969968.1 class II fructose-bisphosphate aldolase [Mordavella massiliensis]